MSLQKFSRRSSWSALSAGLLIALTACIRMVLIANDWPRTNSDEGTVGIMALQIAYQNKHPLIYYGQSYMGTIESYIGAVFFHVLHPSLFTLRFGLVLTSMAFLAILYLFISRLYSRGLALFSVFLLGLAPKEVLYQQLTATAGHPEIPLFAIVIMSLATWLALTYQQNPSVESSRWRSLAYSLWGGTIGLALWDDFLIIPFILMSTLLVIMTCHRELRARNIILFTISFLLGVSPLLYYTLHTAPTGGDPTQIFDLTLTWKGRTNTLWESLAGSFMVSLPIITGAYALVPFAYPVDVSPLIGLSNPTILFGTIIHTLWALGYVLLLVLASIQALHSYWRLSKQTPEKRPFARIHVARLMLLGTAFLILLPFMLSPQPAMSPGSTTRYLIGLLVSFPAALWPLWSELSKRHFSLSARLNMRFVVASILLVLIAFTSLLGTFHALRSIPTDSSLAQQRALMVRDLENLGIKHFYTEYWTCNRVIFQSQERMVCGVLGDSLQEGMNRYLPYWDVVHNDPNSAYVFPTGSVTASAVIQKAHTAKHGRLLTLDGYVVYIP